MMQLHNTVRCIVHEFLRLAGNVYFFFHFIPSLKIKMAMYIVHTVFRPFCRPVLVNFTNMYLYMSHNVYKHKKMFHDILKIFINILKRNDIRCRCCVYKSMHIPARGSNFKPFSPELLFDPYYCTLLLFYRQAWRSRL
jgi:hypothetical protein